MSSYSRLGIAPLAGKKTFGVAMVNGKDREILEYIKQYRQTWGYSPSRREIAEACHIRTISTISQNLKRLSEAGLIKNHRGVPRGIVLVE